MKTFAIILTTVGVWFAGVQWWQIVYRLQLFYREYHGERYANHVDDAVFPIIHVVNVLLLLAGVYSAWTCWRGLGARRWLVVGIAAANVAAWLTFVYMHATGVLVGYIEFIQHWKGQ